MKRGRQRWRFLVVLAWAGLGCAEAPPRVAKPDFPPAAPFDAPAWMDRFRAEFVAGRPPVVLTYELVYRLLGMTLFHLGEARVEAWQGRPAGGGDEPQAFLFDCRICPPAGADARAVLRDRLLLLTDTAERRTLLFARWSDESYRPLLGKSRRKLQFDVYDFRVTPPVNFRTNLLTGVSTNRPADRPGQGRPGQEVMTLLNLLDEVHDGRRPMLDPATSPRVYARVDGEDRPFAIRTVPDEPPVHYPQPGLKALRAEVTAAPEAKTRRGHLTAWTMPYAELMHRAGHSGRVSTNGPMPLRIMPVALDCELSIGSLRARLTAVDPAEDAAKRPPPPTAGTDR